MEDVSLIKRQISQDQKYLNDLAKAVCIEGEEFDKYEKMVIKRFGGEKSENLKHFTSELLRSAERKSFSKSSIISLGYLGRNAGLSQETVDAIIKYQQDKFDTEETSTLEPSVAPSSEAPLNVNKTQKATPEHKGKVSSELRLLLKRTTLCFGVAAFFSLIPEVMITVKVHEWGYHMPFSFWLWLFLPLTLSLLGLLFINSKWLVYVEDGDCRFSKGIGFWGCLIGWISILVFAHGIINFLLSATAIPFGIAYLSILSAYILRFKMTRLVAAIQ